jgi:SAM-dependent methyltransferase
MPGHGIHGYVHGTDPEEQRRLGLMNRLMNEPALREMALAGGERILDVGCGLGQLARAMARAAGRPVLGLERSEAQIAEGRRLAAEEGETDLLEYRQGDAMAPPLEPGEVGAFDLAHARFILEHVPDPAAVVRAMVAAVRPGGRIVLQDEDHDILRLAPEVPGFEPVWRAYIQTYVKNGADPYVGRRLPALLHEAGARPLRATWLFFGAGPGEERLAALVENAARILEGAEAPIVATGLVEREAVQGAVRELRQWGRRPDAALWYAIHYAEGVRRA